MLISEKEKEFETSIEHSKSQLNLLGIVQEYFVDHKFKLKNRKKKISTSTTFQRI